MARFRALGVPVQVDPWFLLGLFFVYTWAGGDRVGLFAAISLGALTLVHELGHALTARRFGCEVAISLNLFVGWASYSARRPLGRGQRIGISLMGPFSQLAIALAGIAVAHTMIRRSSDPQLWFEIGLGLSWAGVVIAGLNLLPLWPLDGGHVVHTALESLMPPARALRAVLLVSFVGIAAMVIIGIAAGESTGGVLLAERRRPAEAAFLLANGSLPEALWAQVRALPAYLLDIPWFLLVFSGFASVQAWQRLRGVPESQDDAGVAGAAPPEIVRAATAEQAGWERGVVPEMPRGFTASPWLHAHVALRRGDIAGVRAALALVAAPGRRWVLPNPARVELAPLVDMLADPVPLGVPVYDRVLLHVLSWHGTATRLLDVASRSYAGTRDPEILFVAAAGLARRGLDDDAVAWLRRAMLERHDPERVANDPAFRSVIGRPEVQALIRAS